MCLCIALQCGYGIGTTTNQQSPFVDTKTTNRQPGRRLVAWIDAVGGYLICLGDEVVLGQPTPSTHVDIPILADLSRRHAVIRRDGEAYVVTPLHSVLVDGVKLTGPMVLRDRALLELGESVKLRFRKPHALSATAVLTLESDHKTCPAVDAIVLMSDSCILGSRSHSHICCRHWSSELVLMRRAEQLMFRSNIPLKLDGKSCGLQTEIPDNCHLESSEVALSFEKIN